MSLRTTPMTALAVVVLAAIEALAGVQPVWAQPVPNPYDAPDPPSPRRAPARAQPPAPSGDPAWSKFIGTWVEVKRTNATTVRGRLWRLSKTLIVVNLGNRSSVIPLTQIAAIRRLSHRPDLPRRPPPAATTVEVPPPRSTPPPRPSAPSGRRSAKSKPFHMEWLTLYVFGGAYKDHDIVTLYDRRESWSAVAGAELGLLSVIWKSAYFDTLRISGGIPYLLYLSTGFGIRGMLDAAGKYELRLGLHLTCPYSSEFVPTMSGIDIKFLIRVGRNIRVQMGIKVFAFPPAAALGAGISF
jgi:hypothetical protein